MDIDDLFDPSAIIASLGLDTAANVSRVRATRGPRSKWQDALISLDSIVLTDELCKRPSLLKSILAFLQGQFRESYVVALEAAQRGRLRGDIQERSRAWKLFFLLPRMLLHRPEGVKRIPKETFADRFKRFNEGKWLELLHECTIIEAGRKGAQIFYLFMLYLFVFHFLFFEFHFVLFMFYIFVFIFIFLFANFDSGMFHFFYSPMFMC